ncbi:F-box protein CPR1 isoform X1 [Gossypium hirsutum]|uniref:F-box protein CPR1 isoform X1 n=1 Tax=Gossypium hirsutum TaxID=3635 RepID=A0ABM3BBK8_GOSHI|nr:F-box protein CPR1-like isoform X1 [Gossypium hirsutum]XP_040964445.1 F-box protein CPR1-like isoform X1 [Gossypium hirsutum]XP_040964446.1 F-box protein CPR1-like isoform X1 [Gossypium hirsutum]XP_040964447.1 F-box protein CPR1-like isoform X1 [Gossypium hirsutum]XP_040964448.1 F-box protein CPR1-like isoform X1 [Gossypium hirsutum]XP_040964449.1 F-box protein CPR1-like isoform X1 [Gossypium hirsutum]
MEVIGDLPRELFLEILLRLPVESLMRCKCVCKYWYALISNPKFIELHLKYNCNNNVCVLLKRCLLTCLGERENMLSLVCSSGFSFINLDVDLSLYKKEPCLQLLGHCDGIICLSNYRDDIVLCNPATRETMVLPESCLPCYSSISNLIPQTSALGFGYDSRTHHCKVVRIISYWEERSGSGLPHHSRVEVYSLATGSWKEHNVKVPAHVWYSPCFETYFNGAFHWYAIDDNRNEVILSFHMGNEEFQVIPMPSALSLYDYSMCRSLFVWNGRIALVIYPRKGIEKSFQIYVMKEYGVRESWTKILTIGPLTKVEMPLAFWKNDEILMEGSDGLVVSYNLKTQELKDLPIYGVPKSFATLVYINSLVSVKGGNRVLDGDNTGENVSTPVTFFFSSLQIIKTDDLLLKSLLLLHFPCLFR